MDKLRLELHKFQGYLDEAEGRVTAQTASVAGVRMSSAGLNGSDASNGKRADDSGKRSHSVMQHHGGSDESLSRSASDSSVSNPQAKESLPGTPQPTHGYLTSYC